MLFVAAIIAVSLVKNAKCQFESREMSPDGVNGLRGFALRLPATGELSRKEPRYPANVDTGFAGLVRQSGDTFWGDTTRYAFIDTSYFNFKWWPPFVGADVFLSLDIFGLHFNSSSGVGLGVGIGGEVRARPLFVGAVITGLSNNEGILSGDGTPDYLFTSFYGGTYIGKYRMEIGGIHGWGQGIGSGTTHYTSLFVGVSRRYAQILLFQPEVRVMFPIAGTFITNVSRFGPPATIVSEHSHLRDLFFGLGLKVGIGYN